MDHLELRARIREIVQGDPDLTDSAAGEIAFHLTDWLDDLSDFHRFAQNPGGLGNEEAKKMLIGFLTHVPNHLAAASKLWLDLPITDVFGVGYSTNQKSPESCKPSRRLTMPLHRTTRATYSIEYVLQFPVRGPPVSGGTLGRCGEGEKPMNASEFVSAWKREKDGMLLAVSSGDSEWLASSKLSELGLTQDQRSMLNEALDVLLTDVFYSLLLGLDGEASIGGVQHPYRILDEDGECISPSGEIEAAAWEQFHA